VNTSFAEKNSAVSTLEVNLCFASNHPDGYSGDDLWSSFREGGLWGEARNLGWKFNYNSWEGGASISFKGDKIFFNSDRNGGFGDADLRMSYREPDLLKSLYETSLGKRRPVTVLSIEKHAQLQQVERHKYRGVYCYGEKHVPETLERLEQKWHELIPDRPFYCVFLEKYLNSK